MGIDFYKAQKTYLFGKVDSISVKSVSQMRVQLKCRRNLHNLQNNRTSLIMPENNRLKVLG